MAGTAYAADTIMPTLRAAHKDHQQGTVSANGLVQGHIAGFTWSGVFSNAVMQELGWATHPWTSMHSTRTHLPKQC